jgi:hypothetical protein
VAESFVLERLIAKSVSRDDQSLCDLLGAMDKACLETAVNTPIKNVVPNPWKSSLVE